MTERKTGMETEPLKRNNLPLQMLIIRRMRNQSLIHPITIVGENYWISTTSPP